MATDKSSSGYTKNQNEIRKLLEKQILETTKNFGNIKKYKHMARIRFAPNCKICGEKIKGKFYKPDTFFCGDTFLGWDYDNHVCRIGTLYMIERIDNNHWWSENHLWTTEPMEAMIFKSISEAQNYLIETNNIPSRVNCEITEHEFVLPAGGK